MNSSSEESLIHIQPNTPVGLKQDQSCQKSPKTFGRIFQNFEKKPHIWYPFPLLAHQPLRDFIYSLWVTAVCDFGLGLFPFMFTLASISERTFSTTHFLLPESCSSGGPRRPPWGGSQPVQPNKGLWSPASAPQEQRPRASYQGKAVKNHSPHPVRHRMCYWELLRQGHPKPNIAVLCCHFSPDLPARTIPQCRGTAATSELWSPEQGSPPETSPTCFQPLFYPYSQNTKCVQKWTALIISWQAIRYSVRDTLPHAWPFAIPSSDGDTWVPQSVPEHLSLTPTRPVTCICNGGQTLSWFSRTLL